MTGLDREVPFTTVRRLLTDAVTARTGRIGSAFLHRLERLPGRAGQFRAVLDGADSAAAAAAAVREHGWICEPNGPSGDGQAVGLLIDTNPTRRPVPGHLPAAAAVAEPAAGGERTPCAVDGCTAVHTPGAIAGPWHVLRHGLTGWLCPAHGAPVREGAHRNLPHRTCSCGFDFAAVPPRSRTAAFLAHLAQAAPTDAVVLAGPGRLELDPAAVVLIDAADAPNTVRAYESRWAAFVEYCAGLHVTETVNPWSGLAELDRVGRTMLFGNFATALLSGAAAPSGRPLKASTVKQYLDTVRARLIAANPAVGPEEFIPATKAVAGRRRLIAADPSAAAEELELIRIRRAPIYTSVQMKTALAGLDRATLRGALDAAVITLLDNLGSRESEVAALAVPDLEVVHGQGMKVVIRQSKTDPKAFGRTVFVPYRRDADLCAVLAVQHWQRLRAAAGQPRDTGPLLLPVDRHGHLGLAAAGRRTETGRIADDYPIKALQRAFAAAEGLPEVTGHSPRRAYVTRQIRAGVELRKICEHTGHRYGSKDFEAYVEAARSFADAAPALE